jgi:cobalamin biosynthesis Mg chelatase CobN
VPNDQGSNIPSKHKSGGTDAPSESESEASKSDTPGAAVPGGSDNSGGGGGTPSGQSNQAGGGDGQKAKNGSQNAAGNINAAQPLPTTPAAETDSDGGSPLVPILIAVAVLAAISIGYFLYRQRRQGSGSTVSSPKAG